MPDETVSVLDHKGLTDRELILLLLCHVTKLRSDISSLRQLVFQPPTVPDDVQRKIVGAFDKDAFAELEADMEAWALQSASQKPQKT